MSLLLDTPASSASPSNTAKLSSPILLQRTVTFDAGNDPPRSRSAYLDMADRNNFGARRRRSSSILQVYHEPPETLEQISDQAALPNLNANWTNAKGMTMPIPVLIYKIYGTKANECTVV